MKNKKTALVLGGGGSRGAYQIGVWQALKELGIRIDMVYGTSVGAINAAMV
ncbi:MAG: patatin-like phospholipase family protein, partial [Firmicutes bacterium]|nr:patatin-like phospholipase family protein [Bacillota bacterium]